MNNTEQKSNEEAGAQTRTILKPDLRDVQQPILPLSLFLLSKHQPATSYGIRTCRDISPNHVAKYKCMKHPKLYDAIDTGSPQHNVLEDRLHAISYLIKKQDARRVSTCTSEYFSNFRFTLPNILVQ
jgi:hypothetical protein